MNTFKQLFLIVLLLGYSLTYSQDKDSTFLKPKGTVYGKIFANYHTQINSESKESAFEIKRAYFGYKSQLSKYFDANIKLDIGSPEDISEFSLIRRYAYFKNAYVRYKKKKLTTSFGIIDLLQFKMQETYWAHRYIDKSFNDRYKFGSSADLGAQVIYNWADWISTDFTLMNGEGYTKLQSDNTLTAGVGISFYPIKNLVFRMYYDYSDKSVAQSTIVTFVGYEITEKIITGIEYNAKINEDFVEEHNRQGYSAYLSYYPVKKLQVFGRYDKVGSNIISGENSPWNLAKDGSAIIAGVEYSPIKYIKIALDYQDWYPLAENTANLQFIFLDVEISF
ncbi:MAG: hypothetical protein R2750_08850 [Bacteroidales bacterium]